MSYNFHVRLADDFDVLSCAYLPSVSSLIDVGSNFARLFIGLVISYYSY